jgi:hypothetical protein
MTARVRFCQNNFAQAEGVTISTSSALTGFEGANAVDQRRWKKWMGKGAFTITSANKTLYINDGSNKTVTLTEATYATGTLLAAHVQTQLNASSSNWTATYSTTTGKFTIGRSSGTATLRLTQTTNAAWTMLGFTGASDFSAGTGTAGDERRNHTSETWKVDLGAARNVKAFFAIGGADEDFTLSASATITLSANSVDSFTSPPYSVTLTREQWGAFEFLDETYRYWQLEYIDKTNSAGPQSFAIHQIYLGDYVEPSVRNLKPGFERELVDPSVMSESSGGNLFWRTKKRFWRYTNLMIDWLEGTDRTEVEGTLNAIGKTTPFFIALDPEAEISDSVGELTKYVVFEEVPRIPHLQYRYYSVTMSLREVV